MAEGGGSGVEGTAAVSAEAQTADKITATKMAGRETRMRGIGFME